jgi:broad specificity phosphatase PhoE
MTRIILVRHGQTEWNRVERFRGHADVPLNGTGLAQAEAAAQRIARQWQPAAIYSSPLSRAMKTAEAIGTCCHLPVNSVPGLIDIDYGEWQGLTPKQVGARWQTALDAWYHQPDQALIPGGESLAHLRDRGMEVISELAARHSDQTIVIVGHTVINRVLLLGMLGLGNERFWNLRQEPCAINVIEAENQDYILVTLNDTCHIHDQ